MEKTSGENQWRKRELHDGKLAATHSLFGGFLCWFNLFASKLSRKSAIDLLISIIFANFPHLHDNGIVQ
jgi:hypothetical protein